MKRILLGVIGLLCLCVACLRKDLSFKPGEVWPDDKGVHGHRACAPESGR